MQILVKESKDKKEQHIITLPYETVLEQIHKDHGWFEVIPMTDPLIRIRLFFDIDEHTVKTPILPRILEELRKRFDCDWAISCGTREGIQSYHIYSTKYYCTLRTLRIITRELYAIYPCFDIRVLYFSLQNGEKEQSYLRFPNQSKDSIHKPAPPMNLIQGSLQDCFVTHIDGLQLYTPPSPPSPLT